MLGEHVGVVMPSLEHVFSNKCGSHMLSALVSIVIGSSVGLSTAVTTP